MSAAVFPRERRAAWRFAYGWLLFVLLALIGVVGATADRQYGAAAFAGLVTLGAVAAAFYRARVFTRDKATGRLVIDAVGLSVDSRRGGPARSSWSEVTRLDLWSGQRWPYLAVRGDDEGPSVRWWTDLPREYPAPLPLMKPIEQHDQAVGYVELAVYGRRGQDELVRVLRDACESHDIKFVYSRSLGWWISVNPRRWHRRPL